MTSLDNIPEWVWAAVEKKGDDESYYALEDNDGLKFVPVFLNQEDGQACMKIFEKDEAAEYELEAVRLENLAKTARVKRFNIVISDSQGNVIEELAPLDDA